MIFSVNTIIFINILTDYDRIIYEYILVYFDTNFIFKLSSYLVQEKYYLYIVLPLYLIYIIKNPQRAFNMTIMLFILVIYTEGTASITKEIFGKLRPSTQLMMRYYPESFSFPSAHALNSMGIFYFLSVWFKKRYLILFAFVIGIARMLSGYHFPMDILIGWFLGYIISLFVLRLFYHFMNDSGSSTSLS